MWKTHCAVTTCVQDDEIVQGTMFIWAECWNLQAVPVKSERTFFIIAIKSWRGFFNMMLLTAVTWLRAISFVNNLQIWDWYSGESRMDCLRVPCLLWVSIGSIYIFHNISLVRCGITDIAGRISGQSGGWNNLLYKGAVWSHPENVNEHIRLHEGGKWLWKYDRYDSVDVAQYGIHV